MRKTVLVADDADEDFFFLKRAFESAGYQHTLIHVRSGYEAIKYLHGLPPYDDHIGHPFPDLVIIDAKMPAGSGLDVLNAARNTGIVVPIVMLTGSAGPGETEITLKAGAAEYLRKPSEPSEMILLAQTIHHRWLAGSKPNG
jgi:CheY-like chemotaxis protein